jgi:hypothetical protein
MNFRVDTFPPQNQPDRDQRRGNSVRSHRADVVSAVAGEAVHAGGRQKVRPLLLRGAEELVYVILPVADMDAVIGMVQQSRGKRLASGRSTV